MASGSNQIKQDKCIACDTSISFNIHHSPFPQHTNNVQVDILLKKKLFICHIRAERWTNANTKAEKTNKLGAPYSGIHAVHNCVYSLFIYCIAISINLSPKKQTNKLALKLLTQLFTHLNIFIFMIDGLIWSHLNFINDWSTRHTEWNHFMNRIKTTTTTR